MQSLLPLAEKVGARLKARGENIAVAESSTGGLLSAALLAVPGASAYFLGGAVVYTLAARQGLLEIGELQGLGETGATGPTGNRYGDAAGHSCIAVAGPGAERAMTLETGRPDRRANMDAFAAA